MTQDNEDICLNIVSVPQIRKKKKKEIEATVAENKPNKFGGDFDISILDKPRKAVEKVEKHGILKQKRTASSDLWKQFKKFNKKKQNSEKPPIKNVSFLETIPKQADVSSSDIEDNEDIDLAPPSKHKRKKNKKLVHESDDEYDIEDFVKTQNVNYKTGKISSLFRNNPEVPHIPHRAVKPVQEAVFSSSSFEDMDIHSYMIKNLEQSFGVTKMTVVQEKAIPILLSGKDALIRSQTGSGKTLAFAVPILNALQSIRPKINRTDGIQVLIIVPTRELALQIYEVFNKLVKSYAWLVPGYIVGGEKRKAEKARLRKGITILIGTPGRLVDHVKSTKSFKLDKIKWLVLDEADRLFDLGYEKDVATLISAVNEQSSPLLKPAYINKGEGEESPRTRQTILLSATLTPAVEKLAGLTLHNPVFVDASGDEEKSSTMKDIPVFDEAACEESLVLPQTLVQKYIVTPAKLRLVTLTAYILWKCKLTKEKKMLVFLATQDMVDFHTELMSAALSLSNQVDSDEEDERNVESDLQFFRLHGNMNQKERTEVFKVFRSAESGVLLCTDVASRGLDLPRVDCVVQYTGPTSVQDYVHRAGRTARGGESGSALIFLTPSEVGFIGKLENCRIRLQEEPLQSCLSKLTKLNPEAGSMEAAATNLQMIFETVVVEQKKMHELACKAYLSWVRFYTSYPKDMRAAFNRKLLHLGHFAKSFALRDSPSGINVYAKKITPDKRLNKKKEDERRSVSVQKKRIFGKKRMESLLVSEFDSGLEPVKKKFKKS